MRILSTINIHFRSSTKKGNHPGRLFFRLIYHRESREVSSSHKLYAHEWDTATKTIRFPDHVCKRREELLAIAAELTREKDLLTTIVNDLSHNGSFCLKDVVSSYELSKHNNSFYHFTEQLYLKMKHTQERTARAYITTRTRFIRFNRGRDLPLQGLTKHRIKDFEQSLRAADLHPNTISFYMRNLRAIYNKAVGLNHIPKPIHNPFDGVFTGIQSTKKRALESSEIQEILNIDLERVLLKPKEVKAALDFPYHGILFAQDLFKFSFFARGMSFVDLSTLQKKNIKDGILTYKRKKTGQQLEIKLTACMQAIIKKYEKVTHASDYVFPIIKDITSSISRQYQSALRKQNRLLKELARLCNVGKNVSTHVARHTWATIAKKQEIPVWQISEGLGHSSIKTTYIYLDSFEQSALDAANQKVAMAVGY